MRAAAAFLILAACAVDAPPVVHDSDDGGHETGPPTCTRDLRTEPWTLAFFERFLEQRADDAGWPGCDELCRLDAYEVVELTSCTGPTWFADTPDDAIHEVRCEGTRDFGTSCE